MKTKKTFFKLTACMTTAALAATLLAACGNTDVPEDTATAAQTEAAYTNAVATTAEPVDEFTSAVTSETEATETEPVEVPVPTRAELLNSVYDNLNAAKSFRMTCNVKGKVPSETSDSGMMIDHTFTYTVSDNKTYLESEFENLDTKDAVVKYSEYQSLDDNIITTLTKHGNDWVDNTPKEMIRSSMMLKALNTTPLLGLLANDATVASDSLTYGVVSRTENGDYVLDGMELCRIACYSEDLCYHMLAGLIRTPELKDVLYDVSQSDTRDTGSSLVYTFDKDYNLKSMAFDAIVRQQNGYDVHCEINFDSWNSVPPIVLPAVSAIETTSAESETSSETTAE